MSVSAQQSGDTRYQPPEVRRQQILSAAARLAAEDGLEGTSMATVAETAGVAKGSIYLHFTSRDDLVEALQAQVWAEMMEVPRLISIDKGLPWVERLDAIVEHWIRYEFEHHDLYHAVFHEVATDSKEPWSEARELLRQIVAGGVVSGEFDCGGLDTHVVVDFLLHGYAGPCYHDARVEALIADMQRLFRRTVGATGA